MAHENSILEDFKQNIEKLRLCTNTDSEFSHLSNQIFLDHAANAIYMKSLIKDYYGKLTNTNESNANQSIGPWSLFSNPHSHSQSGAYTNLYIDLTRQKVLKLFNTNSVEYDVIFVMNATQGLKLVAESFNFEEEEKHEEEILVSTESSNFAYLDDNHTSVIGMRELVWQRSPNTKVYCLNENETSEEFFFNAKLINSPILIDPNSCKKSLKNKHNLMVFPAQSNFNGRKYNLELIKQVKETGLFTNLTDSKQGEWLVCLDAASFVSTSHLNLGLFKPDFLVVSFYKIFGFPTGIGALLVKKSIQTQKCFNKKQYFGGGTVSMVSVDDSKVCLKNCSMRQNGAQKIKNTDFHEFYEDGTISYLQIIAVSLALDKFEKLTFDRGFNLIQSYVDQLTDYCIENLKNLKHYNNENLVEIYRKMDKKHGPIISFNLKNSRAKYIGFTLVDKLAQESRIHLRTGCFCNIGACQIFLNHLKDRKYFLENFELHGHKCGDHIDLINGQPTGALRISFGYSSIRNDIDLLIKFLKHTFIESKNQLEDKLEIDRETLEIKKNEKNYFKITHLFLYPIKSCAPMKIDTSWPITHSGFSYDRSFIIVDNDRIPLSQKRFPVLTKLQPFINLTQNVLRLNFENENYEVFLDDDTENRTLVYANNRAGFDQGDEVSAWLTRVFNLKEQCRLIKIANENQNQDKSSYVNKADYLLINEISVKKLRIYLIKSMDEAFNKDLIDSAKLKMIDYFLMLQFRPNIVVSTLNDEGDNTFDLDSTNISQFEEEFWSGLKILNRNIEFKIVENCTRCQMINIDQNFLNCEEFDVSIFCSSLLKQLYRLKSNSQFGIYLSKLENSIFVNDSNSNLVVENYSKKIKTEVSIGDIGLLEYDLRKLTIDS